VNVLALYHDMKRRGVLLEADGERLLVNAPASELTEDDQANFAEFKPLLLKILFRRGAPVPPARTRIHRSWSVSGRPQSKGEVRVTDNVP
jgi:hypothetical protein